MSETLGDWLTHLVDRHTEKDPVDDATLQSWLVRSADTQCAANGWHFLMGRELGRRVDASTYGSKTQVVGSWAELAGRSKSFWYARIRGARQIERLREDEQFSTAVEKSAFDRPWRRVVPAIEAMLEGRDPDAVRVPPPLPAPKTDKELIDDLRDDALHLVETTSELDYLEEQLLLVLAALRDRREAAARESVAEARGGSIARGGASGSGSELEMETETELDAGERSDERGRRAEPDAESERATATETETDEGERSNERLGAGGGGARSGTGPGAETGRGSGRGSGSASEAFGAERGGGAESGTEPGGETASASSGGSGSGSESASGSASESASGSGSASGSASESGTERHAGERGRRGGRGRRRGGAS